VHLAPAQLGRAHPFFLHVDTGELHPRTMEIIDQAAAMIEQGGIEAWSRVSTEDILGAEEAKHYTKSTDILEVWFDSAPPSGMCCAPSRGTTTTRAPRPTCTWKATTSTAAGSTARCCWPRPSSAARPTAAC
jgi:hypothetical protein